MLLVYGLCHLWLGLSNEAFACGAVGPNAQTCFITHENNLRSLKPGLAGLSLRNRGLGLTLALSLLPLTLVLLLLWPVELETAKRVEEESVLRSW